MFQNRMKREQARKTRQEIKQAEQELKSLKQTEQALYNDYSEWREYLQIPKPVMWEYLQINSRLDQPEDDDKLDAIGMDGWEMVGVAAHPWPYRDECPTPFAILFKKPIQEPPDLQELWEQITEMRRRRVGIKEKLERLKGQVRGG
jgi:hypothetical protein